VGGGGTREKNRRESLECRPAGENPRKEKKKNNHAQGKRRKWWDVDPRKPPKMKEPENRTPLEPKKKKKE